MRRKMKVSSVYGNADESTPMASSSPITPQLRLGQSTVSSANGTSKVRLTTLATEMPSSPGKVTATLRVSRM